jgi:hypothetical protein
MSILKLSTCCTCFFDILSFGNYPLSPQEPEASLIFSAEDAELTISWNKPLKYEPKFRRQLYQLLTKVTVALYNEEQQNSTLMKGSRTDILYALPIACLPLFIILILFENL